MSIATAERTTLSPLQVAELRDGGQRLADCLYALIRHDTKLVEAMKTKLDRKHDYRTIIIAVSLSKTRYSVDLYHRSEIGMRHLDMIRMVRDRARALNLGADMDTPEGRQTYADALLVPQHTWLFGSQPLRAGVAHLDADRLFPAAFLLQDLELSKYSKTFVLDADRRAFLEEHLYLK